MKKYKNILLVLLTIIVVFAGCDEQYKIGEFTADETLMPAARTDGPDTPTGPTIISSCSQVEIEWDTIPRTTDYEILIDETSLVSGLTETKYIHVPEHNNEIEYRIVAHNTNGTSEPLIGTGRMLGTPEVITGLTASDEEFYSQIIVSWDAIEHAIFYRIEVGGEVIADELTETEYIDLDVNQDPKTYSVYAYSTCGETPAAIVTGVIKQGTAPVAPANFTASDGTNAFGVELSWDAVEGVQFYKILLGGVIIADEIVETTYFDNDGTLTPQEYSLVAYNPFGESTAITDMGNSAVNLLANGDFEAAFPGGWNTWGNGAVGSDVIDVYRGDYCGRIAANKGSFMQKNIVLEVGKVYVFKYSYKWDSDVVTNTTVGSYTPTGGTIVSWDLTSTTEWTTESVELTATSDDYKFNFFKNNGLPTALFMDDIMVIEKQQ